MLKGYFIIMTNNKKKLQNSTALHSSQKAAAMQKKMSEKKPKKGFIKKIVKLRMLVFHLLPFSIFFYPDIKITWQVIVLIFVLYYLRMFFVTAGYHRYFSHKTYKLNRFFQFILAFCCASTGQKGALWWAAHHRHHHRYSDQKEDLHSVKQSGFWHSHLGWILSSKHDKIEWNYISDFAKYPELVWLDRFHYIPVVFLGALVFFLGGFIGHNQLGWDSNNAILWLNFGFFLSTVFLYHGTFSINSVMHVFGKKRYETGDESKNSFLLSIVTSGEGWHNNHHFYPSSCRQGFFWWEIDLTYYTLKLLSFVGIVKDIKEPPQKIKYAHLKKQI